jgi:hypothetical protein
MKKWISLLLAVLLLMDNPISLKANGNYNLLTQSTQYNTNVDVNGDNFIDILDLAAAAANYNFKKWDSAWQDKYDINMDGTIDIYDLVLIAKAFGATAIKPVFGSSFIQDWYCQDWDQTRWAQEFSMLQNIGINEIIIQDVVDTKAMYAAYSTSLPGYTHNDVDMLANALTAADKYTGMKVRIGLGFNGDWWTKNTLDIAWLNTETDKNRAIFNEILQNYGAHPSLGGWYIPYEFSQLTAETSAAKANLNNFLKQIGNEIRTKDNIRSIMIAPFYNSNYSSSYSLSEWTATVQTALKDTGIDIVALQDSVGAGYNDLSQIADVFSYTKKATDSLGMKLYADTETFTSTSSGNVSAPQSRISSQLSDEKSYVQGFVAFSIDHYQNNNVSTQISYYNDYYNSYLKNK